MRTIGMDANSGIILDFSVVNLKDALLEMGIKMGFLHNLEWDLIRLGLPDSDMIPAISILNCKNCEN